ncbi:hypothetical protein ACNKHR_03310 [Shigella flexneri]
MKLASCWKPSSKPTAARLVPSICTSPAPKKNARSNSVSSLVARLSIAKRKNASLSELTAAEGLERTSVQNSLAQSFSLEGGDALIPMLKEMIRHAGNSGTREVVLGWRTVVV